MGVLGVSEPTRYALAVGVTGSMISVVEGTLPEVSRSSANFGSMRDEPLRVLPDETVTASAFDRGASEVGRELATTVLEAYRRGR
jgi:hypothetical protein